MPEYKYDWIKLKQGWLNWEGQDLSAFMEKEIGKRPDRDGNVGEQTKGWIDEKKKWKEEENRKVQDEMRKELIDKLKVKLEDVLAAKNVSYNLLIGYLRCHAKILKGEELTKAEEKFLKRFPVGNIDTINKWLHIELGLPTNITELQGNVEKPLNLITLLDDARKIKEKKENAD